MEDEHMDNMDNFRERFEAPERRTQMVEQRLPWWRGLACGVVMLALLSLALPSGKAADTQPRGMAERMATLEKKRVLPASQLDIPDAIPQRRWIRLPSQSQICAGVGDNIPA